MKKVHEYLRSSILSVVDFFYPIFKGFMPLQTYRYAACGGSNVLLDIFLYFVCYNFILQKEIVNLGFIAIGAHIAAFLITFCITFPTGFYLNRYVVFQQTVTKKRVQLFRYFLVAMMCMFLSYILMKLFVEIWHWYPTISKIMASAINIAVSYFSQLYYSFRKPAGKEQGCRVKGAGNSA